MKIQLFFQKQGCWFRYFLYFLDTAEHSESRCIFLAGAIEEAIFSEFKDTGVKYKNRIRSRFSNLRDPKNVGLRLNVLNGVVKPEQLARMSAEVGT